MDSSAAGGQLDGVIECLLAWAGLLRGLAGRADSDPDRWDIRERLTTIHEVVGVAEKRVAFAGKGIGVYERPR